MTGKLRTWAATYAGFLFVMILMAKYPYLLRGEAPVFFGREFLNTAIMAAVGAALLIISAPRFRALARQLSAKRPKQ